MGSLQTAQPTALLAPPDSGLWFGVYEMCFEGFGCLVADSKVTMPRSSCQADRDLDILGCT